MSEEVAFDRITLAASGRPERLTCDLGVELSSPTGPTATLRDRLVLLESKTEQGDSPTDQALAGAGLQPISVSKYRVGVSLVGEAGSARLQPGSELFETSAPIQEMAAGRVSSPNSEA